MANLVLTPISWHPCISNEMVDLSSLYLLRATAGPSNDMRSVILHIPPTVVAAETQEMAE